MLSRRIIALSPDKAIAKQLATALKASGHAAEAHQSLEALGRGEVAVSLVVVHLVDALAGALAEILPRLTGDAKVIAVLPRSALDQTVEIMQGSDRIASIIVAEQLDVNELAAMATRVLAGDIFGLEKVVPWGTKIHSALVGDYQEKSLAIAQLSEYAELMGVRRKYREAIEQAVDEMLMNALYDAPVDEQGRPIFSDIPTKTRISLRVEQKVVIQYACDGRRFSVSVRDAFGRLERDTVLRYLYKCLHSEQQIDRKTGGAGLGLYLIANSASRVYFNVLPGVATEAVCTFDLETPKIQLQAFGFFHERIDAGGRLAAGPSRKLPAGANFPVERREVPSRTPTAVLVALSAAIAAMFALIALLAWPRLFGAAKSSVLITTEPAGATVEVGGKPRGVTGTGGLVIDNLTVGEAYPVMATLDGYEPARAVVEPTKQRATVRLELAAKTASVNIISDPSDAEVEIGGKIVGRTPIILTSLPPKSAQAAVIRKTGYGDGLLPFEVPAPGKTAQFQSTLAVSPDYATVVIQSTPPGAKVWKNGELLPGVVTPTEEILIEAGKATSFTLNLEKHIPVNFEAEPERGARRKTFTRTLVEGTALVVRANVGGKGTVAGVPECRGRDVKDFVCVVKPGTYKVSFNGSYGASGDQTVEVGADAAIAKFEFGFVEAKAGSKLQLKGAGMVSKAAFTEGKRVIYVITDGNIAPKEVTVRAGKTVYVP